LDGSQHLERQGHNSQYTLFLNSLGYTIKRYWNNDVINNTEVILEDILNLIKQNA
jgi:very-short-patch-repair endonuclease